MPHSSTIAARVSVLPLLALLGGGIAVGLSPIFVRLSDVAAHGVGLLSPGTGAAAPLCHRRLPIRGRSPRALQP